MWRFNITRNGRTDLDRLDAIVQRRILEKLQWLVDNFDSVTPLPLGDPWKGFLKLRVGDWRVMYEVEESEQIVTVHAIDRRDKIYRRPK